MLGLQEGALIFYLLLGACMTPLIGLLALRAFKRAVAANMRGAEASLSFGAAEHSPQPRREPAAPLGFRVEEATSDKGTGSRDRMIWRMVTAHTVAGLVFGITAAILLLTLSGTELLPLRTAAVSLAFAWPTVLALLLLVGPDRRIQMRILFCYFGALLVLCVLAWLTGLSSFPLWNAEGDQNGGWHLVVPGFLTPAVLWAIEATPSLLLLLFLNRSVRSIGPLVLVFVVVTLAGSHVALSILAMEPVMRFAAGLAVATGLGALGAILGFALIGVLAAAWPAWRVTRYISDCYADKRFSDFMLTVTVIWLLETLLLASSLWREQAAIGLIAASVPFIAWLVTLHILLRPLARAAGGRPERRLLMLRVFGFSRRSQRLIDLIGARWRLLGGIDLIAAPDLAASIIEPDTFQEFVRGRLRDHFVRSPADLDRRIAKLDRAPDPDGRYRISQTFCSGEIWKQAVTSLMREASLVIMDLRGFGLERLGCVFELQTLLDSVPLSRLAILVDVTTDRDGLEQLARERWHSLDSSSPNLAIVPAELCLLDVSGSEAAAVLYRLALER